MPDQKPRPTPWQAFFARVGPGFVTGAADEDPGGIATHSQAGAQFGLNMLWTVVLIYPLMTAIQSISARIGRVTGRGLAANMNRILPSPVVGLMVGGLFLANTLNIGADLAAMGAAADLVSGGGRHLYTLGFAAICLGLQVFVPYHRYVSYLKWLTLALLAYVAVVFTVKIDWAEVGLRTVLPVLPSNGWLLVFVAVFGTTISPYMLFWETSQEVEDLEADGSGALRRHPEHAREQLDRIGLDNIVGMAYSSLIGFFIMLTTAVTLHQRGITDIKSAADAAMALRPVAGELNFFLFSLGIIGSGLLAVPVLAGSSAYAVAEWRRWPRGLERKPQDAAAFYGVIVAGVILGLAVDYSAVDPMKALFWSAVFNGVISVPLMGAMMVVAGRRQQMGDFTAPPLLLVLGWLSTAIMAVAVGALFLTG